MDAWTQQKQHVADAGRRLVREGLAARTWGNVSCRAEGTHIWITPSGLGYTHMGAEDIVRYDMASGEWEGKHKPSSEKMVHAAAYARFAQAHFVIHTHQDYASALSLAGFAALQMEAEEAERVLVVLGEVVAVQELMVVAEKEEMVVQMVVVEQEGLQLIVPREVVKEQQQESLVKK